MRIKILHVLSNWKWTESSEPSVDLALSQKNMGAEVMLACGLRPGNLRSDVEFYARQKGMDNVFTLDLPKHFNLLSIVQSVLGLKKLLKKFVPDIIHCHMPNAHLIAGLARGAASRPHIIRSEYNADGIKKNIRSSFLYKYSTDGLVVLDNATKEEAISMYDFNQDTVQVAEPGVDLQRFSTSRKTPSKRKDFGLAENDFVMGVVSRIRESRRIDIPMGALNLLSDKFPHLCLMLVGHGRKGALDEVVAGPAAKMGITDKIVLPGYCRGDRLVDAYSAMDVLIYPFPGTDKTCRTVREAMAAGVPVIASNIGFLPEMIEDGTNGWLMDTSSESLAGILPDLIKDSQNLKKIAQNAFKTAQQKFSPARQSENIFSLYHKTLQNGQ